jgi:hypothetical protein
MFHFLFLDKKKVEKEKSSLPTGAIIKICGGGTTFKHPSSFALPIYPSKTPFRLVRYYPMFLASQKMSSDKHK